MKTWILCFLLICLSSCERKQDISTSDPKLYFDSEKWQSVDGSMYPHRHLMVEHMLYTDTIRAMDKTQILTLLGRPSRTTDNYLYYRIEETKLMGWTLRSRTLVIQLNEQDSVAWIKLHE